MSFMSKAQWNEINGILGHPCAHRLNWARRTSWGWRDEWDDTALRQIIRNSGPGSLRTGTLRLGHGDSPQYRIFTSERGRNFMSKAIKQVMSVISRWSVMSFMSKSIKQARLTVCWWVMRFVTNVRKRKSRLNRRKVFRNKPFFWKEGHFMSASYKNRNHYPSMRRSPSVVSMVDQRLRQWANSN